MEFKCENISRGCQESSDKENMILHQTECIYRLVNCPRINCELKVPFHDLLDHMRQKNCKIATDLFDLNECTYTWGDKSSVSSFKPYQITEKYDCKINLLS